MKILGAVLFLCSCLSATDIYFDLSTHGLNNGSSCVNARAYSSMSAGDYAPGNILHICGTGTGTANTSAISVQGNGSSGNPVTLLFELSADLKAPYWSSNGAITCSNHSFITIDGGVNGIIENTANGDSLTFQADSEAINLTGCPNVEVKNLTIRNIFQRSSSHTSNGINTFGIYFGVGTDHFKAHDNNISNARGLIFTAYSTVTDGQIYNNSLDFSSWMVIAGDNNTNNHLSGYLVYGNSLGPHFDIWQDTAQTMHADGVMVFAANSGSSATAQIYNNYIHGDMCTSAGLNCTGYIYCQGNTGTYIFNNVVVAESGTNEGNVVIRGNSPGPAPSNNRVYNNVLKGSVGIKNGGGLAGTGLVIENNIFTNNDYGIIIGPNSLASLATSNFNDFFTVTKIASDNGDSGPANDFVTLANWQAQGFDLNSRTDNPQLDVNFRPLVANGWGTNLTSLGVVALDSDKGGSPRPTTGAWDVGAYSTSVSAPTGLTAVAK